MTNPAPMVQLLLTGDELMSGDTVDSNSALIARELAVLGLVPARRITLGDDPQALRTEIQDLCTRGDVLLINGGLGPTIDDLTAEVLAQVAEVPLAEHPEALEHLDAWCERRGLALNDANRKQALLPEGCEILPNPVGSAVGFCLTVSDCLVLCTPGVPGELRAMLNPIKERLQERFGIRVQRHVLRLQTFGVGESTAQQLVLDDKSDWPSEVALSFRAGAPQLEIKLTVDVEAHLPLRHQCRQRLETLFGDHIVGEGDRKLAAAVIDLARDQGKTITTAESCTGGLIAQMLTQIPGSSDVFPGGIVSYANEVKASLLSVSDTTLTEHGAVSEATVREMVQGALKATGADLGVAVSGVAGPGGGSADKPVGTVWLAWGDSDTVETVCLHWPLERVLFQTMVAAAGLDVLRRRLLGIPEQSFYLRQRRIS